MHCLNHRHLHDRFPESASRVPSSQESEYKRRFGSRVSFAVDHDLHSNPIQRNRRREGGGSLVTWWIVGDDRVARESAQRKRFRTPWNGFGGVGVGECRLRSVVWLKGKSRPIHRKPPVWRKGGEAAKTLGEWIISGLFTCSYAEDSKFDRRRKRWVLSSSFTERGAIRNRCHYSWKVPVQQSSATVASLMGMGWERKEIHLILSICFHSVHFLVIVFLILTRCKGVHGGIWVGHYRENSIGYSNVESVRVAKENSKGYRRRVW